ncbi:MAG: hypothetical protein ACXU7D_01990 [Burkholderiaceae bacterium]
MTRSSSFNRYQQGAQAASTTRSAKGVADFLRTHDKMSALLPTVTRMAALQKDCAASLPAMFNACTVLLFESDQLTLSTPNAAIAAKLKQQLPKLQGHLLKCGWQVSAIRLKVQVSNIEEKVNVSKSLTLPLQAISALATLGEELEETPQNAALKKAIGVMLKRHRLEK